MSDFFEMAVGILVPLLATIATFISTLALLVAINSLWGLLLFLTWPFVAVADIMFVLWWDER